MNPFPSIESAYSRIIREERHSLVTTRRDAKFDAVTFATRSNQRELLYFVQSMQKRGIAPLNIFGHWISLMVRGIRKFWNMKNFQHWCRCRNRGCRTGHGCLSKSGGRDVAAHVETAQQSYYQTTSFLQQPGLTHGTWASLATAT